MACSIAAAGLGILSPCWHWLFLLGSSCERSGFYSSLGGNTAALIPIDGQQVPRRVYKQASSWRSKQNQTCSAFVGSAILVAVALLHLLLSVLNKATTPWVLLYHLCPQHPETSLTRHSLDHLPRLAAPPLLLSQLLHEPCIKSPSATFWFCAFASSVRWPASRSQQKQSTLHLGGCKSSEHLCEPFFQG